MIRKRKGNIAAHHAAIGKKINALTIEKLDNVREVHVVFEDDAPVVLHHGQRDEEDEVSGRHVPRSPDGFPHAEHVLVHKLCGNPASVPSLYTSKHIVHCERVKKTNTGIKKNITSLEVEQEPTVAKVEVRVVAILVHELEHLPVQYLKKKKKGCADKSENIVRSVSLRGK